METDEDIYYDPIKDAPELELKCKHCERSLPLSMFFNLVESGKQFKVIKCNDCRVIPLRGSVTSFKYKFKITADDVYIHYWPLLKVFHAQRILNYYIKTHAKQHQPIKRATI